jgi:homoserine dehydrogenase
VKQINIVQAGFGLIGSTVARQILANHDAWQREFAIDIRTIGVANSGGFVAASPKGLSPDAIKAMLYIRETSGTLEANRPRPDLGTVILMDAAAGTGTTDLATEVLSSGGGVVYSNKAPLSQATTFSAALWDGARTGIVKYETTCGAGLPVISTLRSLLATGDEVIEIVGCLSGTLGAIFSSVAHGLPMSQAIRDAKDAGYTEPDPRDDLSGLDVARKALILARTIGRTVELEDIEVESLVPAELVDGSIDEFMNGVARHDQAMTERQNAALAEGRTLKYVATVPADGPIKVGVQPVSTSTVIGALQGPENIISIRTKRYDAYPLTISGPGAGAEVTAAGMIADMLDLARGR